MPDFVAGQRGQPLQCRGAAAFGPVMAERRGEQGQGDPARPRGPAADLVFVRSGRALAGPEGLLHRRPATPTKVASVTGAGAEQRWKARSPGCRLRRIGRQRRPAHPGPKGRSWPGPTGVDPWLPPRPPGAATRAGRAVKTSAQTSPALGGTRWSQATPGRSRSAEAPAPGAVGGRPPRPRLRPPGRPAPPRPGLERSSGWPEPAWWQTRSARGSRRRSRSSVPDRGPVDGRVALRARIGRIDRALGVVDLSRGAGVLPLHPGGGPALLHVPGLVSHRHRLRIAGCSTM